LFPDSSTIECSVHKVLGKDREKLHFCIRLNEQKINGSSSISSMNYTMYEGCRSMPVAVPLDCWDRGFESRWRHACSSLVFVVHCVFSGLRDELITRSEEFCPVCVCLLVCVCELGTSRTRGSRPEWGYCATKRKTKAAFFWYIRPWRIVDFTEVLETLPAYLEDGDTNSVEYFVHFYQITRRHIQEQRNIYCVFSELRC
jgi:hypothetical protein